MFMLAWISRHAIVGVMAERGMNDAYSDSKNGSVFKVKYLIPISHLKSVYNHYQS